MSTYFIMNKFLKFEKSIKIISTGIVNSMKSVIYEVINSYEG